MSLLRTSILLAAVGVAFADSSIVVLAVPEILRELDVSVTSASWVITAYNVAVLAAGLLLLPLLPRLRTAWLAAIGFALFGAASAGCALAPSFAALVGFRAAQGAAAALVLVAALPLLGGRAGVRAWSVAATLGFAAGPALGGILTELFSWRSIFVVQAPLVAAGLLALRRESAEEPVEQDTAPRSQRRLAHATLAALSGALVGALFLVVVLLINGFGWQPLPAALVATTLPALAFVGERAGAGLAPRLAAAGGGLLVVAGLATLALLPSQRTELVVAGMALCGAGLGLAADPLGRLSLSGRRLTRDAGWTVVARHAGLVAALLVVTPVLVSSLEQLEDDAEAVAGEVIIRAPLPLGDRARMLVDLAEAAERAEVDLPDVDETLEPYDRGEGVVAGIAERLDGAFRDLVAHTFRNPFLVCAGFGLLAALLALGLARDRQRPPPRALTFLAAAFVAAAVALGATLALGALDDPAAAGDPCRAPASPRDLGSNETIQRVALGALAGAACDLGTSRAALLRGLTGSGPRPWTDDELGPAIRAGANAAIDAEEKRGTIEPSTAVLYRALVAATPLNWIGQAFQNLLEGG